MLFLVFWLCGSGAGFEYFQNPVSALSDFGFPEETQVLPNGSFRTHCGTFQILPIGADPQTSYTLSFKGDDRPYPVLEFTIPGAETEAKITAFAATFPKSKKVAYKASTINLRGEFTIIKTPNMVNFISAELKNKTGREREVKLALKYDLGTGIPMKVDYQSAEFIYYDWKGKKYGLFDDARLYGEGREVLFASTEKVIREKEHLVIRVDIPPMGKKGIIIYLPYFPMSARDGLKLVSVKKQTAYTEFLKKKLQFWDKWKQGGILISVPESKPLNVFYASQIYLLENCIDRIGDHFILRANPFQYDQFYIRDGAHQVRALDLCGMHDIAEKCLDFFLLSTEENGRIASQKDQDDAHGMALYALGEHYLITGNNKWAEKVFPKVKKSVQWLERYRNRGLLPASRIRDNEQVKNAHIVGHNLWAFTGLESSVFLAQGAGEKTSAQSWSQQAEQFKGVLDKSLWDVYNKCGGFISPSFEGMEADAFIPGRFGMKYGFDWGNLVLVYPSAMLKPEDPRVTGSMKYWRKHFREGLFPYPERGYEDQLHHYLTMDITQTSLARGEYEDVLRDFYEGYLLHTTNTHGGCERLDRQTRDFIPKTNLTPHGAFAAKYIELLRNFFLREGGDHLHLCSFLAPRWCEPGSVVRIENAPTHFGKISFYLEFSADKNQALLQIKPPDHKRRLNGYIMYFPPFLKIQDVHCDGKHYEKFNNHKIILPVTMRQAEIGFVREPAPDIDYNKTVERFKSRFR